MRNATKIFALLSCLSSTTPAWAGAPAPIKIPDMAPDPIRKVLDTQVAAWNKGDLEGYMAGYWKSAALSFFAGGTATKGWQQTLERYRKRYQGEGREMGKLTFSEVQVDLMSPDAAFVRGRWQLQMEKGKGSRGLFTLIVRRLAEGWRIIHDHSSAE